MRNVYVCSPLRGNITENIEKVKQYGKFVLECGMAPVIPHFYAEILDDTVDEERTLGMTAGTSLLFRTDAKSMPKNSAKRKGKRILTTIACVLFALVFIAMSSLTAFAAGDVSSAIQSTWTSAQTQIKNVVNNVVFPVIDMILAVLFFVKLATAYMDYRKHGQFEFAAPAILFGCLVFALTAPMYIWTVLG